MKKLSQRDPRWANIQLGTSNKTIGTHGCTITALAIILDTTPDVVNQRLKDVGGYASGNLVIWDKIAIAFPGTQIHRVWSYNNDDVLANVPNVIVEVDGAPIGAPKHWVVFIGNKKMIDPWTGQEEATSKYTPLSYCIIKPPKKEDIVCLPIKEVDEMRKLRDTRYNFIKDICELFGVSYQDKLDKLLENFKSVWAGHQSTVSRLKGDVEKLIGDLGVANEKVKIYKKELSDKDIECSRRVTELEILLQEAKKDSPDLEKLVDEYEGMLGVERDQKLQLQKKYDKARVDLARVTSQLKALPFIEKLKLLFL